APSVLASSSRAASRVVPVTTISDAPACRHATTCESPCWPGPWIRTVDMNPTCPSFSAHSMPFDSGVMIPASSSETTSGSLWMAHGLGKAAPRAVGVRARRVPVGAGVGVGPPVGRLPVQVLAEPAPVALVTRDVVLDEDAVALAEPLALDELRAGSDDRADVLV